MKDKSSFKHTFRAYDEAKKNYDNLTGSLNALAIKREDLQAGLLPLEETVTKAKENKTEAFDSFCAGKVSQSEVDKAQETFEKSQIALKRAKELLDAVAQKEQAMAYTLPRIRERMTKAQQGCWTLISGDMIEEMRGNVGDKLHMTFAAVRRSSSYHMSFQDFLMEIAGGEPAIEGLDSFNPQLEKKFKNTVKQIILAD